MGTKEGYLTKQGAIIKVYFIVILISELIQLHSYLQLQIFRMSNQLICKNFIFQSLNFKL